jgi:agmatine deiminase
MRTQLPICRIIKFLYKPFNVLVSYGLIILLLLFFNRGYAQEHPSPPQWKLMHYLSEEEMHHSGRSSRDFTPTDPPYGSIYNVAEFDQQEGVLIAYPFGIPLTLIAEMSQDVTVTTIVLNLTQENTVKNIYESNGVRLDHCNFLYAPHDSYWTRDYGPWFVMDGNHQFGIVDFPYNRPRPNDDNIPVVMAGFLGVNLYGMDLTSTGGNYMTDGYGVSASSTLIWEENASLSHDSIAQIMNDYLGIETYNVLPDPLGEYIKHIDCWGKFLDVDKVLIGQVPPSDPRYDDYEYVADFFSTHTSGWNKPYQVYRVYTPGDYPYTPYTNSLILNNKVFVPLTGSQWDDEAISTYQDAMPGYEVIGVYADGGNGWLNSDALHCRVMGIADRGMLLVRHMPYWGDVAVLSGYPVQADIIPMDGQPLIPDSVVVYYKVNGGSYNALIMSSDDDTTYTATIPGGNPGDQIAYYIRAVDQSGKSANHPYIGAMDPHVFHISGPLPDVTVTPDSLLFVDFQQMLEGQMVAVHNYNSTSVTINYINNEGINGFPWYIDPWTINPPQDLAPGDSIELNVKVSIPVDLPGPWITDTLFVETDASTHKVILRIDSDLLSTINDSQSIKMVSAFPNPFSDQATISFILSQSGLTKLVIYDMTGKKIKTLVHSLLRQGSYTYRWDGTAEDGEHVPQGIYICRLTASEGTGSMKMVLTK